MRRQYDPIAHDASDWIFWRWRSIYTPGSRALYLKRLYLLRTPWLSFMLHWLKRPDSDRFLHDHPWPFLSLILRGGYYEAVPATCNEGSWSDQARRYRKVRWFNFKSSTDAHMITCVAPNTLTLVITGRKSRKWGFYTDKGHVYWRDYLQVQDY